jgi:hypothetical protein
MTGPPRGELRITYVSLASSQIAITTAYPAFAQLKSGLRARVNVALSKLSRVVF